MAKVFHWNANLEPATSGRILICSGTMGGSLRPYNEREDRRCLQPGTASMIIGIPYLGLFTALSSVITTARM
jgi:hypothetical protein